MEKTSSLKSIARTNVFILAVGALLIGLILGALMSSLLWNRSTQNTQQTITVPIGALLELTGDLESYGKRDQVALELAVQDINAFAESVGSPFRFKLLV
ncbi:MAG: hypothetical protein ACPLRJ_07370, partial [Infirmifilum uzonense]